MPIHGRSEIRRIPRVGKIHLGIKVSNGNTEYPKATDHFVVRADDDTTSEASTAAFQKVYGEQPKEITIAFPSNDPLQFFPQFLSSYRKVGGGYELFCKGDGKIANRADGKGGRTEMIHHRRKPSVVPHAYMRNHRELGEWAEEKSIKGIKSIIQE